MKTKKNERIGKKEWKDTINKFKKRMKERNE